MPETLWHRIRVKVRWVRDRSRCAVRGHWWAYDQAIACARCGKRREAPDA